MSRRSAVVLTCLIALAACSSDGGGDDTVGDPGPSSPVADAELGAATDSSDEAAATTAPPTDADGRDFSAIDPIVDAYLAEHGLNGAGLVVVERDDGIVHESYWGEFDADRASFIASSSKMITAGVLGRLADDGLLDLDAPVAEAVDWGAGNPDITPLQLVANSSGLVGLLPNPAYGPYLCQFVADREIEECGAEIFTTDGDNADVIAPDSEFRYGGAQWQVAGALAESVSGRTWAELIDEIYVEPCGVDSLGYNNHITRSPGFGYPAGIDPADLPPTDNPNMEGGAYITPHDYGTLLLMHLRGGECDGGRVLSAAMVDRLHDDHVITYDEAGAFPGYAMGWWVDRATGRISDPGAYGAVAWLDLDAGYGAFLVVEATGQLGAALSAQLETEIDAAMS